MRNATAVGLGTGLCTVQGKADSLQLQPTATATATETETAAGAGLKSTTARVRAGGKGGVIRGVADPQKTGGWGHDSTVLSCRL